MLPNLFKTNKTIREILLDDGNELKFDKWFAENKGKSELVQEYNSYVNTAKSIGYQHSIPEFKEWVRVHFDNIISESTKSKKGPLGEMIGISGIPGIPDNTDGKEDLEAEPVELVPPEGEKPEIEKRRASKARSLSKIAQEIKKDWRNVYFGAKPYLAAMMQLDSVNDNFGFDSGRSVVAYFLGNASTWRGEKAKEIKKELKAMLK